MTGLLLDYAGVLTGPVVATFTAFETTNGLPPGRTVELLLAEPRRPDQGLIAALERGELDDRGFEAELARRFAADGHDLPSDGLLGRLFAALQPAGRLWHVARRAREAGIRTGLLSNSWGMGLYPMARLAAHLDVLVISGQVGLRKPDPAIYALACERLGMPAADIVFVDDMRRNVDAARDAGLQAIMHAGDDDAVTDEVAERLGLAPPPAGWTVERVTAR